MMAKPQSIGKQAVAHWVEKGIFLHGLAADCSPDCGGRDRGGLCMDESASAQI